MVPFIGTAIGVFVLYLILTAGSGHLFFWSIEEIIAGIVLSLITAAIASRTLFKTERQASRRMLNPVRLVLFAIYLIPLFIGMLKANFDVAYRVITGKINPGIVKVSPGLKTSLGITMLANSITLTPGTLSVDVDEKTNDLYVHWINVKNKTPKPEEVCGVFLKWVRRITE